MALREGIREDNWLIEGDGTLRTTITHEIGHWVESYIKYSVDVYGGKDIKQVEFNRDLEKLFSTNPNGMSEYAHTNTSEMFAEGYAAIMTGEETDFANDFNNLIKKHLGRDMREEIKEIRRKY